MASFILTAAIRVVKSRIGVWKSFEKITSIVPEVTREEWARAIGEAKAAIAQRNTELTRPLNRRPVASEFGPLLERRSGAKYWQQIEVYIRDRDTGARSIMHFTTRTDTLRSRASVIQDWVEYVQGLVDSRPEDYPIEIIGAAYTGTYPIVPKRS